MSSIIGLAIGALAVVASMMAIVSFILTKLGAKSVSMRYGLSALIVLVSSTVLAGYGFADGGSPVFSWAFYTYSPWILLSLIGFLVYNDSNKKNTKKKTFFTDLWAMGWLMRIPLMIGTPFSALFMLGAFVELVGSKPNALQAALSSGAISIFTFLFFYFVGWLMIKIRGLIYFYFPR
ncbi:MAG: hypothetical protein COC03_01840 [Robiginitomaculum sp.]|nr:MAG: hypothetical protein COC03_01840 [Robiginitomaculum sp.]